MECDDDMVGQGGWVGRGVLWWSCGWSQAQSHVLSVVVWVREIVGQNLWSNVCLREAMMMAGGIV